jgi:serine/threonine protein kinase
MKEEKLIGKGSAGEVWLARYHLNNEEIHVAIKEIPVDQKESRDQFVQDLKCFVNCDSPYVVKFYGCFYKEGYLSEVIEYMNMGSLRDIINLNIKNGNRRPLEPVLAELSYCVRIYPINRFYQGCNISIKKTIRSTAILNQKIYW